MLGYIGFAGVDFTTYYQENMALSIGQINQNCMNMFSYKDKSAFAVRLAILLMILSGYPIIHFFTEKLIEDLFCYGQQVSRSTTIVFGIGLNTTGLMFAIFYPNVGTVLAYVGAAAGFIVIYTIPVVVHLSQMKQKIEEQT